MARAWIVTHPDRRIEELPEHLIDAPVLRWPDNALPTKAPTRPVQYFSTDDLYYPHVLEPGSIRVYVHSSQDADALPSAVATILRDLARRSV
jgi:hypothetical protein